MYHIQHLICTNRGFFKISLLVLKGKNTAVRHGTRGSRFPCLMPLETRSSQQQKAITHIAALHIRVIRYLHVHVSRYFITGNISAHFIIANLA